MTAKPLKFIAKASALCGLALTGYGFVIGEFDLLTTFVLTVFFFWTHIYAANEIEI